MAGRMPALLLVLVLASRALAGEPLVLEVVTADELGREAIVQVVTPECRDLGELSFDLHFDPELVFPNAVDGIGLLEEAAAEVGYESPRPGLLYIVVRADRPINGSGPLLELHFEAYADHGGSSALVIDDTRARGHALGAVGINEITVQAIAGKVTMEALEKSRATMGACLLLAVAALLLLLLLVARVRGGSPPSGETGDSGETGPED